MFAFMHPPPPLHSLLAAIPHAEAASPFLCSAGGTRQCSRSFRVPCIERRHLRHPHWSDAPLDRRHPPSSKLDILRMSHMQSLTEYKSHNMDICLAFASLSLPIHEPILGSEQCFDSAASRHRGKLILEVLPALGRHQPSKTSSYSSSPPINFLKTLTLTLLTTHSAVTQGKAVTSDQSGLLQIPSRDGPYSGGVSWAIAFRRLPGSTI